MNFTKTNLLTEVICLLEVFESFAGETDDDVSAKRKMGNLFEFFKCFFDVLAGVGAAH